MAFDVKQSAEIIEVMENYIAKVRPPEEIRDQVDLGYEIKGQSIILFEIRPVWDDPRKKMKMEYAKATFVGRQALWKLYWMRANGNWYPYDPEPTAKSLSKFLEIVNEDKYGCFHG